MQAAAAAAEEKAFRKELEKQKLELQRQVQRQKLQAELDKLRGQLGGGTGTTGTSGGGLRTVELFGVINGMAVPLTQAVQVGGGSAQVVPGARVMRGDSPSDGFGLGGTPGRWSSYYGTSSPSEFGLPPTTAVLGSDGQRGWVLTGDFLRQLFGNNWSSVIA